MKIIGFNYTKILAERLKPILKSGMNTDVRVLEVKKEESSMLKGLDAASLTFVYHLTYNNQEKKEDKLGEIKLEGNILISLSQEESKELFKLWKKKEVPSVMQLPIFNFILRKCTLKAMIIQDELGLPSNVSMPKLSAQKQ